MKKVLICGFMGCGKSTFVESLETDYEKVDLDKYLVIKYLRPRGLESIAQFIEEKGWQEFRDLEHNALVELFTSEKNQIIALGGGTLTPNNREFIRQNQHVKLVWLDLPFEVCWGRIKNDRERPLVRSGKVALLELYIKRKPLYSHADLRLDNEGIEKISTQGELNSALG